MLVGANCALCTTLHRFGGEELKNIVGCKAQLLWTIAMKWRFAKSSSRPPMFWFLKFHAFLTVLSYFFFLYPLTPSSPFKSLVAQHCEIWRSYCWLAYHRSHLLGKDLFGIDFSSSLESIRCSVYWTKLAIFRSLGICSYFPHVASILGPPGPSQSICTMILHRYSMCDFCPESYSS